MVANQKTFTSTDIARVHEVFCRETGVVLRLGIGEYNRERCWLLFLHAGFTADDIRIVCKHLRKEIAEGRRMPGALRFRNLVEQLDYFEEELGMAKAALRKPQPTAKDKVLAQARPLVAQSTPQGERNTARSVTDLLAEMRKAIQ